MKALLLPVVLFAQLALSQSSQAPPQQQIASACRRVAPGQALTFDAAVSGPKADIMSAVLTFIGERSPGSGSSAQLLTTTGKMLLSSEGQQHVRVEIRVPMDTLSGRYLGYNFNLMGGGGAVRTTSESSVDFRAVCLDVDSHYIPPQPMQPSTTGIMLELGK